MLSSSRRLLRRLASTPGFTLVAVLTLGLGIGANTAIFSVVKGVLLDPLPFERSEELVFLERTGGGAEGDLSLPDGRDLRAQATTLEELALYWPFAAFDLAGDGEPERVSASAVETEYFRILRASPLHGRTLTTADAAEAERVVVLAEPFWRRRFGGDPEVIGRAIRLTGEPYTVVGVMPSSFDFLQAGTDAWVPIATAIPWAMEERGTNNLEAVARLAPGVSLQAASAELRTITRRLAAEHPDTNQGKILTARNLRDLVVGGSKTILWVIFGAVGLVLLIACVNVANLLLVRATGRESEMAVRMAIGGGRTRVAATALAEAALLSLIGGALGALLAVWGTELLVAAAPSTLPRVDRIGVDGVVLGFTLGLAVLTALVFGWVPALHAMRRDPAELLARGGGRGAVGSGPGFLGGFVVVEVALATLLLVGSGLLLRSFLSMRHLDLGFEPEGVLTANLVLPESRYSEREVQEASFERIVATLEDSPGVERAAFVLGAPLVGYGAIGSSLAFDDRPAPAPGDRPGARLRLVLGDYFETLEIPLLRGRRFVETDEGDAPRVAIVNEAFSALYWPGENPVGKRVATLMSGEPNWMTVVGVAGDVEQNAVAGGDEVALYLPYAQREMPWARFGTLVAEGPADTGTLTRAVKEALWTVDPTVPFDQIAPLEELADASVAPQRFAATLVALFSALALLIAVQGLYGVLAYTVARREDEIGLRIALGARTADVLGLVMRRGALLTALGLGVGLAAALVATRLIGSLLFGVSAFDPSTYLAVAVALSATALAACAMPALRAARLDPAGALREE